MRTLPAETTASEDTGSEGLDRDEPEGGGSPRVERSGARTWLALPAVLFGVALLVRLAAMLALSTPEAAVGKTAWEWGGESACLAEALVEGRGYADPWGHGTGASSWLTPVYPSLVAILMKLFGGVNAGTAGALFVIQSIASAATCLAIWQLGLALGRGRAGWLAGWLFAFYPPAIWNPVQTVWDTTLVALFLTVFLWRLVRAHESRPPHTPRVARLGAGFGLLLFLNPAPLAILPAVLVYMGIQRRKLIRSIRVAFVFTGVAFGVCLPWMVRNRVAVSSLSLRPNFGVEMMIGNNPESIGRPQPTKFHPSHVPEELALYRELGEGPYASQCAGRALAWMRANPLDYALLSLKRIQFFWVGEWPPSDQRVTDGTRAVSDWKSWLKYVVFALSGALALLALFAQDFTRYRVMLLGGSMLLFGAPYFLTHVSERYRFPIAPLILLLDAWFLLRIVSRRGSAGRN